MANKFASNAEARRSAIIKKADKYIALSDPSMPAKSKNPHVDHEMKTVCGMAFEVTHSADTKHFRIVVRGVTHPKGKLSIRFKSFDRAVSHILNHSRNGDPKKFTNVGC